MIIGEEDDEGTLPRDYKNSLDKFILKEKNLRDEEIPLEELALFVDPLDGTREFVEGRLKNVACLIGITRNNRPVAGVIGLPFPDGSTESDVVVHYALTDQKESAGSWPTNSETQPATEDTSNIGTTILTGDSNNPVLMNATACAMVIAKNPTHTIIGGTAAKLRLVATKPNCLAILHFKTELWDTCAPEALIASKGGKITDLFGSPLVHSPERPFGNIFSVVASSGGSEMSKLHDELCSKMRADHESVHKVFGKWLGESAPASPQAMDVARNLDGIPFTIDEIRRQILQDDADKGPSLKGYSVPESGAWRGLMSTGGRMILDWDNDEFYAKDLPSSVFYKRVVMSDLAHARDKLKNAPHKLVRDVRSYQVETAFLTSKACQEGLFQDTDIRINKVFGSDLRPVSEGGPRAQLESRFSVLLEDFDVADGWFHQWLLDEEGTKAALKTFAQIHAYFWTGSKFWKKDNGKLGEELKRAIWPNGGYMQPALQGYDQYENIAKGWMGRYPTFKDALAEIPELQGAELDSLGERLEKIAAVVGKKVHPFSNPAENYGEAEKYKTLIHGDPKQANIFFKHGANGKNLEVGLIDFQWCGFGLAATDVAHHISAAVLPSCVSYDGSKEKDLLDYYYACLSKDLVKFGVAEVEEEIEEKIFPRAVLQEQYEIAILDICRMVFAYAWRRWKAESEPTAASLNRNAYNKSFSSALWLITRCYVLLETAEKKLKL